MNDPVNMKATLRVSLWNWECGSHAPRDTALVALGEDSRGVAVLSHAVQRARGDILVRIGSGQREDEQAAG